MKSNFEQKSIGEKQVEDNEVKIEVLLRQNKELKEQIKRLEELLTIDPLTETYNRRYIETELKNLFEEVSMVRKNKDRRINKKDQLSVIFLDIDNFKQINDTYGHKAGDIVLKEVSGIIKYHSRSSDKVARYGGEEFVIILVKANDKDAYEKAENFRKMINEKKIKMDGETINVTVTLGIASLKEEESFEELLHNADKALYQGKITGKNKTVIYYQASERNEKP